MVPLRILMINMAEAVYGSVMASVDAADAIKIPRTQAYSEHLARGFQQLRLDDELTNFTIHTATRSFRCHQAILAVGSPVLKAMLTAGMYETSKQEVRYEHISADVMEIILTYIYTGEVVIPEEQLLLTIEASDYFELLEMKEMCLKKAVNVCRPSNAISMFKLAEQLDTDALKSKCTKFITFSLVEISKLEEFHRLHSSELSNILSSAQELDVDPDDLLEATMDWIEYKPDERITSMENLVQKIDISGCSLECIESEMEKRKELLIRCPLVQSTFAKSLEEIAKQEDSRKKCRRKRGSVKRAVILGGIDVDRDSNKQCWELNQATNLTELCQMPDHSCRFAVCHTPNGFAVTGGEDYQRCSVFIVAENMWESLLNLTQPRCVHGSACVDGNIMLFGGDVSGSRSASVQYLNMVGGEWTDGPDIPRAVRYPEVSRATSGIFLLDTCTSKKLFHLDLESDLWSTRASVPRECRGSCWGARMVCVDHQLLVAGGCSVTKMFAHYNITTDTWTTGNPPSLYHFFGAMFYDNRTLYLMGGKEEDHVEEYDMDMESWSFSDIRVPQKLMHLHALVLYT